MCTSVHLAQWLKSFNLNQKQNIAALAAGDLKRTPRSVVGRAVLMQLKRDQNIKPVLKWMISKRRKPMIRAGVTLIVLHTLFNLTDSIRSGKSRCTPIFLLIAFHDKTRLLHGAMTLTCVGYCDLAPKHQL